MYLSLLELLFQIFLSKPSNFAGVYVWSDVWQHIGWDSIIYLAALSAIDPTYYEAATMMVPLDYKKLGI